MNCFTCPNWCSSGPLMPTDSYQGKGVELDEKSKLEFQSGSLFTDGFLQLKDSDVFVRHLSTETASERKSMWKNMVTTHWPRLLKFTGFNIEGKCVRAMFVLVC